MLRKIMSMDEVLDLIPDNAVIGTTGFVLCGLADAVFKGIEQRYLKTGHPKNLQCVFAASQGIGGAGYDRLAHDGLIGQVIGGHLGLTPVLGKYIADNHCKAYNYPLGVVVELFRTALQGRKGLMTKVGLKTFVDPRLEGGKINAVTTENLVRLVEFDGEEWLYYPTPKFDVAILRGTTADADGNISIEHEASPMELKAAAMGVKACGGKVIVQVKYISDQKLTADKIEIPGIFVDAVVVAQNPESDHRQTQKDYYDPSYSGHINVPVDELEPMPLDVRKVLARRAAMELTPNSVVNLGIGVPGGVSFVAAEEGFDKEMTMTTESGILGGIPGTGNTFGAGLNPIGMFEMSTMFDFYNGGNLDIAVLGLAEVNEKGDINVSKFGPKVPGCGGFINITQNTPKVVFCGAFTAGGTELEIGNGELHVVREGKSKKFVKQLQQVTFSGEYGASIGQNVLYVTERAVFRLTDKGLMLIEIAPGIDLQKDILDQMEFKPIIAHDVKQMDSRVFSEGKMGLKI